MNTNTQTGFIKAIMLITVLLIIAGYQFNLDIKFVYEKYLLKTVEYIWELALLIVK